MAKYRVTLRAGTILYKGDFDIADPTYTAYWVTKLTIELQPPGTLTGKVRYEDDAADRECTLTPNGSQGEFKVNVQGLDGERTWKLWPRLAGLIIASADKGITLTGRLHSGDLINDGWVGFEAVKYTPPIKLFVRQESSYGSGWKPCKSSEDCNGPANPNYSYKFEGGDDNEGGLFVPAGQTERVTFDTSQLPKDFWIKQVSVDTNPGRVVKTFQRTDSPYVEHVNSNTGRKVEPASYTVKVVTSANTEIWCDPVIKNKPTGS